MSIVTGGTAVAADFINQTGKNATPTNDAGKVPKLEADGRLAGFFTRLGEVVTAGATINGATLPVPVYQDTTSFKYLPCIGNDTTKIQFQGFAVSNSTDTNPITVQFGGVVAGFTGLTRGVKYYLDNTSGLISATPGTYQIYVGVAISTTEILIQKGRRRSGGNGTTLGNASGSLVVTLGYRPQVIRVFASQIANTTTYAFAQMNFTWMNGAIVSSMETTMTANASNRGDNTAILYEAANLANYQTFTITSVTDTGFTITWTKTGTFNSQANQWTWEAEGEF